MDSTPTVFTSTRRGSWLFLICAVLYAVIVGLATAAWPDLPSVFRGLAFAVLVVAIYEVAAFKPHELTLVEEGLIVRSRKGIVSGTAWDRVAYFKVSRVLGKVGWRLNDPKGDPTKPRAQAPSSRRPVNRFIQRISGVDGAIVCRQYRGISNQQLADLLNERLEQRRRSVIDNRVQDFMDVSTWPLATGKFLAENWVMHTLKEEGGRVRIEDALGVLGALTGFSVIASLHRLAEGSRETLQRSGLNVVGTTDGTEYYFGDLLNHFLLEDPKASVLASVCSPLRDAGLPLPDATPIVQRVASTVGSDQFGIPDLPPEHMVRYRPIDIAKTLWPQVMRAAALEERPPGTWTMCFLHAIRILNENSPGLVDDTMRARIVLECALPTAHLDPDTVLTPASPDR